MAAGPAIGAGLSLVGSILGAAQARGGVKRAGQVLSDAQIAEVDPIYQRLKETNAALADAYLQARQSVTSTADQTATHLEDTGREANTYLDPYMTAGSRSATTLADLANAPEQQFAFQFNQDDPSYQFRLQEGQKALQASAAARGTLLSGGALKSLTNYGQQAASQEYQAAYQRAMDAFKANQAARQQRMTTLTDLARMGGTAATQAGQNLTGTAQTAGNWRNQAANTEAGWNIEGTKAQVANTLTAEDLARAMRLGSADATARSIAGAAGITGDMWSGAGRSLGDLVSMLLKPRSSQGGGGGSSLGVGGPGLWSGLEGVIE